MVFPMRDSPTTQAAISAKSKRQAMDWSLVLASQGIGVEIARDPDRNGFILLVDDQDQARAREAIDLYLQENRGIKWIREFPKERFAFGFEGVWWCLLLVIVFILQKGYRGVESSGIMDSVAVLRGETWRLVTATFLHQDLGHLASNLTFGFLFLGLAMPRYGAGVCALTALLSGSAGNYFGIHLRAEDYKGLGASGSVMGLLGLLAMQTWPNWARRGDWRRAVLSSIGGGAALLMLVGTDPRSDVLAHAGGFLAGCAAGSLLAWLPAQQLRSPYWNRTSLALAALIAVASWVSARPFFS